MLPVIWTLFAVCVVGGFIMIAAYWLDIQDRPDFTFRQRVAWSVGVFIFPIAIPVYAFLGGPAWPRALRAGAILPAVAIVLFVGFLTGRFS